MAIRFRRHQEAAQAQTRRLLVLFAVVVLVLALAVNAALALAWHLSFPLAHGYPALFFETNTGLVLLAVLGGCWFEQWRLQEGGAHVARLAGGVPAIGPHGQPNGPLEKRLLNVIEEMALAGRMRPPEAWVLPRDDAINAFAAGWGEEDAVIGVTRGALERLTREELQGVVAHECSHLAHGDTRLNMRLIGMVWGLEMVFGFGRSLTERDEAGRLPPAALFGWALMGVGSLGWLAGRLLQAAVSRQREFLADASAVQYTRNAAGLAGALRKIAGRGGRGKDGGQGSAGALLHAPHAAAIAHLLLSAPGASWWASHPPLAERIRRLLGRTLAGLNAPVLPPPREADEADRVPAGTAAERASQALSAGRPATAATTAQEHGLAARAGTGAAAGRPAPVGAVNAADPANPHSPPLPRAAGVDATLDPRWHGNAEREREALVRIGRWAGPGERRAALLALLLDRAPAGRAAARHAAWQLATKGLACAPAVWDDLALLSATARLETLASLALRSGGLSSRAERLALRAELHALADGPAERLRALAIRHLLDGRTPRWRRPDLRNRLPALAPAIAWASTALAHGLGLAGRDAADWSATVLGLLGLPNRGGVDGSDAMALRRSLACLRRLAPLERPRLARAWLDASAARLAHASSGALAAEMLRLACLLLDTPPPQGLVANAPGPGLQATLQPRSL